METFWKQKEENNIYINTDTKYLVKIKNIYYFCFRFKKRIIKISLKCKELYKSNILKIQIIKRLKLYKDFKNMFNTNDNLTVNTFINKDEDPQKVKEIEDKILKLLTEEKKKGNIENIDFNTQNITQKTITEAFEEVIEHKKKVEKLTDTSIGKYRTALKYLLLFCEKDKMIHTFNKQFFKDIQNKIRKLPKNIQIKNIMIL